MCVLLRITGRSRAAKSQCQDTVANDMMWAEFVAFERGATAFQQTHLEGMLLGSRVCCG